MYKTPVQTILPPFTVTVMQCIYVRLQIDDLKKEDWVIAIEKMMQLLTPGSAIQSEEGNFPEATYV